MTLYRYDRPHCTFAHAVQYAYVHGNGRHGCHGTTINRSTQVNFSACDELNYFEANMEDVQPNTGINFFFNFITM